MDKKKLRKVKKGKNCVFWSFSDKKQFFPYCYNSIFGFFETRSSNLFKDYLSKGLTLFNSQFYKGEARLKNYKISPEPEKIFNSIYSNRFIRGFTTYSDNLDEYKSPEFLKFYYDNYGYIILNSIIYQWLIKCYKDDNIRPNEISYKNYNELEKDKNITEKIKFFCSDEKKRLLNINKTNEELKNNSIIENLIILSLEKKDEKKEKVEKNKIFYFETYPYWLSLDEILKLENYYNENKDEIENFYLPLKFIYKYYFDKFYRNIGENSQKIVERYIVIQKAWIYLISLIKKNGNLVILDGSFSDFKFFPFLSGFLPQQNSEKQIFDLYIFGDNLTFGMGKNIIIVNDENIKKKMKIDIIDDNEMNDIEMMNDKENLSKKDKYDSLFILNQPYFNPYGFELLYANLRRCMDQFHYSILLRYLYIIESRKEVVVIGPYIYVKDGLNFDKDYKIMLDKNIFDNEKPIKEKVKGKKPYTIPLKIPEEIFLFILRQLPDKKQEK
ncbi:MAG TPA: hypothetical protein PLF21_06700 [Exilispira sp.]|nr:hypothetical protein [Exilispira sp.]